MVDILIAVAAFIVALGVLVTVHELGHFWVARRCGVRVLRFSVGFGRPLWSRRDADGTEWVIAAIPLGGYVRMLDERDPEGGEGDMREAFNRAPPTRKIAISLAGPAANFLFAIFAYWVMFVVGVPGLKPVVGEVLPDTPAAHAGLHAGDRLVQVAGKDTPTWEAAILALLDGVVSGAPFEVVVAATNGSEQALVLSSDRVRELTEPGALLPGLGMVPWRPVLEPVLGEIESGGAADAAGLRAGDRVLSVDGEAILDWPSLVERVQGNPGRRLVFSLERGGSTLSVAVDVGIAGDPPVGRIGAGVSVPDDFMASMRAEHRFGPLAAIPGAVRHTLDISWLTLKMLGRMFTGEVSVKQISGPINIAQYAGFSASLGLIRFLSFMAVVSISLGIINLLPVPILDGGHLLYHLAELVRGRPVSERTELLGQRIGLGMLAMLMGLAIYNDLARIFA